jgi:putative effector of murein hydrolase
VSTTDVQILLSVVLALVVIAVLAVALILVRRRLESIADGLATLAHALGDVEAQHLRPLEPAVKAINAQFEVILAALPGIARKAAVVAERRPR